MSSFDSPNALVAWAREDLEEILQLVYEYEITNPYQIRESEPDEEGFRVVTVEANRPLPSSLAKLAHNAVNNIRHSFDQATYALLMTTANRNIKTAYFPWAETPFDLSQLLERRGIPRSAQGIFASLQPYNSSTSHSGGDDLLRNFAKAVNPNKHRTAITVTPLMNIHALQWPLKAGEHVDFTIEVPTEPVEIGKGCFFLLRYRDKERREFNHDLSYPIVFADEGPLKGKPLMQTIEYAATKAQLFIGLTSEYCEEKMGRD